jgi:uncharacterized protein (DUF433 family)
MTLINTSPITNHRSMDAKQVCGDLQPAIVGNTEKRYLLPVQKSYHSDPEILGGIPVFVGTRVPIQSLFDHLEAGESIDQFLEGFPSVKREQIVGLLGEFKQKLLQPA